MVLLTNKWNYRQIMSALTQLRNIIPNHPGSRSIFELTSIFNRVSRTRIMEVGPDRACAEWLMRNGAFVRWKGRENFVTHYNSLPLDASDTRDYFIEEVFAEDASVSHHGFDYFANCNCIEVMTFRRCWYINDPCLEKLYVLEKSLKELEICECAEITGKGLEYLEHLKGLNKLILCKLRGVKDPDAELDFLCKVLPGTTISTMQSDRISPIPKS